MILLILLGVIAAVWYCVLRFDNQANSIQSKEPPKPPSQDVWILGCDPDCGYFNHKFKKLPNGDYEFLRRNGNLVAHCAYQNCEVCVGDPCQFGKDHPDKLTISVFSDEFLDIK